MRVILVHNRYRQTGGEDLFLETHAALLEKHGHEVTLFIDSNENIAPDERLAALGGLVWSSTSKARLREEIGRVHPDIAHFHNTFARISPSVYYACRDAGIPVIQTIHNYRLLCPAATLFRNGTVCEACLGKGGLLNAVVHKCYRQSGLLSGALALMLGMHRMIGTWTKVVDTYIALTGFARDKLVQGGLPEKKICVLPTFIHPDVGVGAGIGGYALFVGRLSREKGVETLIGAWQSLGSEVTLKIVGGGPMEGVVREAILSMPQVELVGSQPKERVAELMREARFLVFPSMWYEGLPAVIVEAYSAGLPVLASNLGAMASLVRHGETGLHFLPGSVDDLVKQVRWALGHDEEVQVMRRKAREEFENRYSAERHYEGLMAIYEQAFKSKSKRRRGAAENA